MRKTKRENLNVFIDASLIYMDDYHQREGTRLEIMWFKGDMEHRKPLSTIEFDDDIRTLILWRDATFGTNTGIDVTMMSQPLMLDSVSEHVARHALETLSKHMPGLGWTTSSPSSVLMPRSMRP